MKKLLFSLLFAVAVGLVVGGPATGKIKNNAPIRIGAVLPLTGELAVFGEMQKNGYELALKIINDAGGVKGRRLEILIEDDKGRPEVARAAVEKLISSDKIVVLTGGYSSTITRSMALVAQHNHIPYVVHTGAADSITESQWDCVFRINQPTSEYFKGLMSFMKQVAKPKTAVVVYDNSLFGRSQSKSFVENCERNGCKVLLREGFESGSEDFKPLLTRVKGINPDLFYAIAYVKDAALLARQSKELNFRPKLFVGGGGGFSSPTFPENAGDSADYVYCVTQWSEHLPFPGAWRFHDDYSKAFKTPPRPQSAQAYVALFTIRDALSRAREVTPTGIQESLTYTDMQSLYGPIKFISYGKKTKQNSLPTYLAQWQDGKLELVWPLEYAAKPFVYPIPPWKQRASWSLSRRLLRNAMLSR
jgi:branched-chain amino acid transport system substrate-binding protein